MVPREFDAFFVIDRKVYTGYAIILCQTYKILTVYFDNTIWYYEKQ